MSKIEEGDLSPGQKVAKTLEEYKGIAAKALEMNEKEFGEYVAGINDFHEIDRLRGALRWKLGNRETGTEEKKKIRGVLAEVGAKYKKLKPKSKMGIGDAEYLEKKKGRTIYS